MSTQAEDRPEGHAVGERNRLPVAVLTLAGLSLVIMGQAVNSTASAAKFGPWRWLLYLLIFIGLLLFSLAGLSVARPRVTSWISSPTQRLANFMSISIGQLAMLTVSPLFGLMAYLAAGDGRLAHDLSISLAAWIVSIAAVLVGGRRAAVQKIKIFDGRDWLAVILLFFLAFALRAINLENIPNTLSGDEGSAGLFAIKFLDGEVNNIFGPGWFSFPALYFVLQSLGIYLLGQTAAALRISSALAGALTVVALYWLARLIFNRRTAVIAALFLAVFHYHIHFSRIGLNNIWDGLFAILVLGGLAYGWKSGRCSGFQISGLALGLGHYFYVSIRIFPLLILFWALIIFLIDRPQFKSRLAGLLILAFTAFIVALPLNLYYLSHPAEYYAPLQRVTIFNGWLEQEMINSGRPAAQIIARQILDSALGITNLPLRHWYNPGTPLLLAGAAGLFLLGLVWLLTRMKELTLLILLPLLAVVILGGFTVDSPASQRYIMAAPIAALLVALPLAVSSRLLIKSWPRARPLIYVVLILIVTGLALNDLRYYFLQVYDDYILGGPNTEIATEVAHYLKEEQPSSDVYFFGLPRMGFFSHSTIPFLAPEVSAVDIADPLNEAPAYNLETKTVFIFLPEREGELSFVREAYPQGMLHEFKRDDGAVFFYAYEVAPP